MKASCLIKRILTFIILTLTLYAWAQQADPDLTDPNEANALEAIAKIPFTADSQILTKNIDKNNLAWTNVLNEKHLVFKRSNQGRVYRGNVILFHTAGENPLHNRLINPLSVQLSNLGWNTFSTNIGFPDFPRKPKTTEVPKQPESDQQDATEESLSEQNTPEKDEPVNPPETSEPTTELNSTKKLVESFFKTQESFQEYFSLICQETLKIVTISQQPTIILANGEAAYWVLGCLKQMAPQTPIVLIQPKVPFFAQDNLNSTLESLDNPVLTFSVENNDDYFVKLIRQRKLRSTKQRFNQSALVNSKINIENTIIAKLITGWIKSINSE